MDNIDLVFSDSVYKQLQDEYSKLLPHNLTPIFENLNNLIQALESNNFQMPLTLQNQILNNLLKAHQVLTTLYNAPLHISKLNNITNNPFNLIYHLSKLSLDLNSYPFKSAYQTIYLKANELVLKAINEISNHFKDKQLKIFKFM